MKVLVVAAHPDDELLGVGGTIVRHLEDGDEVTVALVYTTDDPRGGDAERMESAIELAADVGYSLIDCGLPKVAGVSCRDAVAELPAAEVVYTHWRGDLNADHRAVAEAVEIVARPGGPARSLRMFDTPSSTEWGTGFVPNLFVAINAPLKSGRFTSYYPMEDRGYPHPRSWAALLARAEYWGQISGLDEAEAFHLVRESW